jgi:hypothetical protein
MISRHQNRFDDQEAYGLGLAKMELPKRSIL